MKQFKNIICQYGKTDGKAALKRAVQLAKENKAKLTVVEVIETLPPKYATVKSKNIKQIHKKVIAEVQNYLDKEVEPFLDGKVTIQTKVLEGTPFVEIIKEVLRNGYDLVIKEVRPEREFKELLFGTSAMHLMRKCPCPVWVIKSTQTKTYNRILAAIDPDPSDSKKQALNLKIIQLASSLSVIEKSGLDIVHSWSQYSEVLLGRGYLELSQNQINQIAREAKTLHKVWMEHLIQSAKLKKGTYKVRLLGGDPGKEIPEFVKKEKIDLIVMGTLSRSGANGLFIGNTAEKVLNRVKCSLITIKPDGFVTPVKL